MLLTEAVLRLQYVDVKDPQQAAVRPSEATTFRVLLCSYFVAKLETDRRIRCITQPREKIALECVCYFPRLGHVALDL